MVLVDGKTLTTHDVWAVANGASVSLCPHAAATMDSNHQEWIALGSPDVLAGKEAWLLGASEAQRAPSDDRLRAFVESHCAGVGALLPDSWVRALMLCRANVLACGLSGVRSQALSC